MDFAEKRELCKSFVRELESILKDEYELLPSCNKDESLYLIPKGTSDQVTYYGKPNRSIRYSDHWNWYANTNKCSVYNYIQCLSVDIPWTRRRTDDKATKPRFGVQVAMIMDDGKYHCVYGDKFDRKTKTWNWVDASADEVVAMLTA